MTEPGDGSFIADKGWPARKLYLSPEAIALMENHCKGTPLTMSAYVDMLIKRDAATDNILRGAELTATDRAEKEEMMEPPAVSAERARAAALHRGIGEAKAALTKQAYDKQPTKKDFDIDV